MFGFTFVRNDANVLAIITSLASNLFHPKSKVKVKSKQTLVYR